MAAFDHVNVLYDVADSVATLTLNRPEKRNALDDETIAELKQFFAQAEQDDDVLVVVLRGAGNDFCAGADLSQLEKIASNASREENLADAMNLGELFIQMRRLPKPIVAASTLPCTAPPMGSGRSRTTTGRPARDAARSTARVVE